VSGKADSIRERRARETWDKGWEEEKTTMPKTTSLTHLVVQRFADSREQIAVLEKLCEGRLDLSYLEWNGLTNPPTVC
jgi:hypothetical protein